MQRNSSIFIAGHRGLVGSAILRTLTAQGYSNIITRTRNELDLTNEAQTAEFFRIHRPEYVFLAAAKVGGIVANNKYRAEFIYDNLKIQNNVVHHSYLNDVKKLLFLGSTCIYPKACPQPMKESYLLTDTLEYTNEPYAIAKIAGIKLCESYNLQFGTNFISVMPTNLYGPRDNFDLEKSHVLPALIRKMHLGKAIENNDHEALFKDLRANPIEDISDANGLHDILTKIKSYGVYKDDNGITTMEIWGSGKPKREFLWSEDMAGACIYLMETINFKDTFPSDAKEIRNTHLNIGTGEDVSIAELADLIKHIVGFKGQFYYNTDKPDGTMRKLTDVSKINALGWKHKINLEEGIRMLYQWYLQSQSI